LVPGLMAADGVHLGHKGEKKNCPRSYALQALQSQALVLLGDLNLHDTCWKHSTVNCRQSRRLLEHIEDNFLSEVIGAP